MPVQYNPIVRTFGRVRSVLVNTLDLDRRHVCPAMPLELIIPIDRRREVWDHLRQAGLEVPALELSPGDSTVNTLVAVKTAVSLMIALKAWVLLPLLCVPIVLLRVLADRATSHRAVYLPSHVTTVGELVLSMTSFRDLGESGYRPTRNEIAFKVRVVVAESLGLALADVKEESTFDELGGWC